MPKPVRVEYEVGATIHGQRLLLIREKDTGGRMSWTLKKEASSQRDETDYIRGLTDEALRLIGECAGALV